jgi:hypothetical protein
MSAVLQSPTLPTLINIEDLTAYIDSEIKKGIEKAVIPLKAKIAYLEAELAEVKSGLDDNKELLAISLKRNTRLEQAIFEHDSEGEIIRDEDNNPKVSILLNDSKATEKPTEEKAPELPIIPTTSLDLKAEAIVTHLKEEIKPSWSGNVVINNPDFYTFFKEKVTEGLRWKPDLRNPRQAKKEILERAVKLYPGLVEIIKNKSGNRITGIALKTSGFSSHTYA